MATMPEGSKEELLAKLQSYQKFMADYIVKAQEQKLAAVRAAEAATAKKYEEKLLLLGGAAAAPAAPAIAAAATPTLFAERNAKISAAAGWSWLVPSLHLHACACSIYAYACSLNVYA